MSNMAKRNIFYFDEQKYATSEIKKMKPVVTPEEGFYF